MCPPNSVVTLQDSRGPRLSKGYRPAKVLVWNEILMFVGTQGGPVLRGAVLTDLRLKQWYYLGWV